MIDEEQRLTTFTNADFGNCPINTIEAIYEVDDLSQSTYYVVLFKDGKIGHFPWSTNNESAAKSTKKLMEISRLERHSSFNGLTKKVCQVIAFRNKDTKLMLMAILDDGKLVLVHHNFSDESWLSKNVDLKMTIEVDEGAQKTFDAEWIAGEPFNIGGRINFKV